MYQHHDSTWTCSPRSTATRRKRMRLYNGVLKNINKKNQVLPSNGVTIIEIVIASLISSLLISVASSLLVSNIKSGAGIEAKKRKNESWSAIADFIKSEVTLSEFISTDASELKSVLASAKCNNQSVATQDIVFGLKFLRDVNQSIYYHKTSDSSSSGSVSLWRCGPSVLDTGTYSTSTSFEPELVVDGMSSDCKLTVNSIPANTSYSYSDGSKSISLSLCIRGLSSASSSGQVGSAYSQNIRAFSRVTPFITTFPSTSSDDRMQDNCNSIPAGSQQSPPNYLSETHFYTVLICGQGGVSKILGTEAALSTSDPPTPILTGDPVPQGATPTSDIIELITTAGGTIEAGGGRDILLGNSGNDNLNGGTGDDLLDGFGGNDTLNGDSGDDKIVVKTGGVSTVNGGSGFDVLYIDTSGLTETDLTNSSGCSTSTCSVAYTDGTSGKVDVSGIETIVTKNIRFDVDS